MIIRPVCRRNFVALPNVVLTDERLSIETRGMIAYLLSRPPNWQIKTVWLARALSKKDQALGRTKLTRMLREARTAGYLARSADQNGSQMATSAATSTSSDYPKRFCWRVHVLRSRRMRGRNMRRRGTSTA